nr:septal ring lytic transglycosylase RlpA family protein [Halomonas ventosae]
MTVGFSGIGQAHEKTSETQQGVASYYSDRFQGRTTASGEPFDQKALTAAHPSLPFGTKVLVTREDNGREVEVLINDRGPYAKGRIIDLSKRAAKELGMLNRGTVPVEISFIQ